MLWMPAVSDINTPIIATCVCLRRLQQWQIVLVNAPLGRTGCGLGTCCTDTPEDDALMSAEEVEDDAEES